MKIFNIQHFSTGDGPGIRTTVFLAGCSLKCPWCHNPECNFGPVYEKTADEILSEVLDDGEFYAESDGGVTISGGEPFCSAEDLFELLTAFKKHGLHTIVDTSLSQSVDFSQFCKLTDCFFVDLKTADAEKFREVCGGDFSLYENNVKTLISLGANVVFRIPLIPGFNTDEKSLDGIAEFIKKYEMPCSLVPFHRMGSAKYKKLGMEYAYANVPPLSREEIGKISEKFGCVTA